MNLITKDMILLDVDLASKKEVIDVIANVLQKNDRLSDKETYMYDVYERENIVPTSIGDLIAIPHALSAGVLVSSLVFLRLVNEIQWNEFDKVKYIFGIAVPISNNESEHLRILSNIARKMLDEDFKKQILYSDSKDIILRVFEYQDD